VVGDSQAQIARRLKGLKQEIDYLGGTVSAMAHRHDDKMKMILGKSPVDDFQRKLNK